MKKLIFVIALMLGSSSYAAANELNLDKYAGKVVILDFWASWCVPCRRSFPWMNEMQEKYAQDGLVVIAVNLDRDAENAAAFLAEYPAGFDVVYDPQAGLAKEYEIQVMPTSFVIGRNGETIDRHSGFKIKKQDDYEAVVRSALDLPKDEKE
jgi:cytochrome c biogenesis protein CcmG/thiol:disulfide interchange protein DsbE